MSQSQQNPFTEPAATGSTTNNNTTGADSSISNAGAASGITPAPAAAASGGGGYGAVGGSSHGGVPSGSSSEDAAYARPDPERDGPGANYREKPTTTGGGDELESKAPVADDRAANWLLLVLIFLSWVGCWVVFTGRMASLYTGPSIPSATCQLYWDRMTCVSTSSHDNSWTWTYSDCTNLLGWHMQDVCDSCRGSGQGSLALAIFAFFFLTPLLVMIIARLMGKDSKLPWVGADTARYAKVETVLVGCSLFCFWVIMMLFRTKCMETAQDWSTNWENVVVGSGWWYVVGAFFFLLTSFIISLSLRTNPWCRGRCRDTLSEQQAVIAAANAGPAPSCGASCSTSPAFATRCDSVLNIVAATILFLIWVGTIVGMGGELHRTTLQIPNGRTIHFKWDSYNDGSNSWTYESCDSSGSQTSVILTTDQCNSCFTGGRGTVGMAAFGFIVQTVAVIFMTLRFSGKVKQTLLKFEWMLTVLVSICMLFVSLAWGGTCFNSVNQGLAVGLPSQTVGTGWGYTIFCFVLSTVNILVMWIVRHRAADLPSLETGGVYASVRDEV